MTDNFDKIQSLLNFRSEDDFTILHKDNPTILYVS